MRQMAFTRRTEQEKSWRIYKMAGPDKFDGRQMNLRRGRFDEVRHILASTSDVLGICLT